MSEDLCFYADTVIYEQIKLNLVIQIKGIVKNPRINVIYCRVSSNAQKPELSNQAEAMKEFCTANGITIDKIIKEIGGGLNFKRKKDSKTI